MRVIFDKVAASVLLIVLSPAMLIIALCLWISQGQDVVFRQKRVGFKGREFTLYKFRTMVLVLNSSEASFCAGDSSRVTKIGAFLRKTKLDELPQLVNILKGDMAFVGPRPEIRKWVDEYPERWKIVLSVRPGITDPASIFYRHEELILAKAEVPELAYKNEILPHKLDMYITYVNNRTVIGDIGIVLNTLFALFRQDNQEH